MVLFPIHADYGSSGVLKMGEMNRIFAEELNKYFNRMISYFDQMLEDTEEDDKNAHRLSGLQHQARQPRLAAEEDVRLDTKTRERTGVAADDDNYGDISFG